jgi:hypothetical protein
VGLGGLGIGLWMNMFIFINHGILWVLVLQIGFICLVIFDASIFHFFPKTTTRHAPVDTSPELPQAISQYFFHLSRRDLNHGIQTLIKLELFGGFLLILNIFPFLYLVQIFNFPNLIPLFLQFFPYLIIGTILWGIIYHITQNREIILLGSTITLIPVPMLIGIDPYGIFIYHTGIMWMLGLSIPGIWLGTLLYTRSMVNGHYVQSFWGIGIVANLILGNIFGSLIESDEIDPTTGQYGLVIIASIIILLILGKIISKLFPYQIQPALDRL